MTARAVVIAIASLALVPSAASAYRLGETYGEPVLEAGGGDRYFTGSTSDGQTCAVCHRGGDDAFATELRGLPEEGYVPGTTYDLEVPLPDSITASAVLEVVDLVGGGAGALSLPSASAPDRCAPIESEPALDALRVAELPKNREVVAIDACGARRMRVTWTAPATARGPVWVHAAVVAADGSGDPEGDGVRVLSRLVPSYGEASEATRVGGPGCSALGDAPASPLGLVACVAITIAWRRARRW